MVRFRRLLDNFLIELNNRLMQFGKFAENVK